MDSSRFFRGGVRGIQINLKIRGSARVVVLLASITGASGVKRDERRILREARDC